MCMTTKRIALDNLTSQVGLQSEEKAVLYKTLYKVLEMKM